MKNLLKFLILILTPIVIVFWIVSTHKDINKNAPVADQIKLEKENIPVDHSKFVELQQEFATPQDVTKACLKCHNNVDKQLMMNEHWKWLKDDTIPGRGHVQLGKKNILNNFCIGSASNEKLCAMCHAGYGFNDKDFDLSKTENMDCIVCHDNTGTYHKANVCSDPSQAGFGYPPANTDLSNIALHVGLPKNHNCGSCHYFGGGGNNVKHGDLEMAQNECTRDIDVHMASKNGGPGLQCIDCHKTKEHNIPGNLAMMSASPSNSFNCTECHTDKPHKNKILNRHYKQVACQTCHIPTYAKGYPTKMYWSWGDAGRLDSAKMNTPSGGLLHYEKEIHKDSILNYIGDASYMHNITGDSVIYEYDSRHAAAILVKNAKPDYMWYNGYTDHHFLEDPIKTDTVILDSLMGSYSDNLNPMDPKHPSKIYPVKTMRGDQIYDTESHTLINPKLVGPKGSGGYWNDFNWDSSATKGMGYLGKKYSGHYGFIQTKSYWPLNHEVAPAEEALSCEECHSPNGRLQNLTGFYMPGRDHNSLIDWFGILAILGALFGVLVHGTLRMKGQKNN